jgi:hypothetical protein
VSDGRRSITEATLLSSDDAKMDGTARHRTKHLIR